MRRNTVGLLFVIGLLLVYCFVGCSDNNIETNMYGSLSISAISSSRTIEPNIASITCSSYVVKGTHENGTDSFEQDFSGSSVTVEHLLVGNWTVYVEGYNSNNVQIGLSASKIVTINPASTTNTDFSLEYMSSGTGTLNMALRVASSDTAVAKVAFSVENDVFEVSKPDSSEGDYYVFRMSHDFDVGQYNILVALYDSTDTKIGVSLMEVAHIYKNLTSTKEWDYTGFTASPVFTPASGLVALNSSVSISSATDDAVIYYTTDGSVPTTSSPVFSTGINLNKNTIIKAVSTSKLKFPSPVITAEYHIKSAAPSVNVNAGIYENSQSVTLSTTTAGSSIYYTTDGSEPTEGSTKYNWPISITRNTTVKAITINQDYDNSDVVSFEYHIKAATPTSSVVADAYEEPQSVVLSCATSNAEIYYTMDGSSPTNESTLYTGAIDVSSSQTLKAIAYAEGYDPSPVFAEEIVIATEKVGAVTFNVDSGTYFANQSVTLSAPEGTTMYYTTDGSTPTRSSTQYSGAIAVNSTTTIKAIAGKWGYLNSDVVTKNYVIKTKNPSMSVEAGSYQVAQSVSLSCETEGATIYYTTNGSTPTTSSAVYSGPITVGSSKTIKAIAKYSNWDCSEVVSVSYQIDGLAGFSVTDPVHYSLSLEVPDDWVEGEPVIENVAAELIANISPYTEDVIYTWYIDNIPAISNSGTPLSSSRVFRLGTLDYINTSLTAGIHVISVKAIVENITLYSDYIVFVTDDATIGTAGPCYPEYSFGDTGPAGGFIFYDCDSDNDSGNEDGLISSETGWRYLEAAPADLQIVNGIPTVDSSTTGYSSDTIIAADDETRKFYFGCYRNTDAGENLFVNGTTSYDPLNCTKTEIGTGKTNTQLIIAAMGNEAYKKSTGSVKTSNYAARLCDILEYTYNDVTFDDWFLPSLRELSQMYILHEAGFGGFLGGIYLSSSEVNLNYDSDTRSVWGINFWVVNHSEGNFLRNSLLLTRPIRSF